MRSEESHRPKTYRVEKTRGHPAARNGQLAGDQFAPTRAVRCKSRASRPSEVRYRQPARVGEKLLLKGWIESERRRLIVLKGEIRRAADDKIVADCESSFMLATD